jgi:hypothetical protein
MPRIRTIKPEYWSSPSVAGANPWVRLLYIAMWNWADDHGRGTANVKELAAFAFPHDDDPGAPTSAELPCMLAEIADRFSVVFYEADGRRYYAIPSWDTHQRNERRANSKHPAPNEGKPYNPDPTDQRKPGPARKPEVVSDDRHGTSVQDDGSSDPGTGEQGNRGTGENSAPAEPGADAQTELIPAKPTKPGTIAQRIAQDFASRHKPCNFHGVMGIAKQCVTAGESPERILGALEEVAAAGRPITADTVRNALHGTSRAQTVTARAVAAADQAWDDYEARHGGTVHQLNARPGA